MKLIPKAYPLFHDAIESGARYGYGRAFKHDDNPSEEAIIGAVTVAVIDAVLEVFDVDWERPVDNE